MWYSPPFMKCCGSAASRSASFIDSRLSAWRKIAIGTWRTCGDPSVYGLIDVNIEPGLAYIEKARAKGAIVVGTGVACATKDYGTGADCSLGTVEIDPDGHITIHSDVVEIGNGIGTALVNSKVPVA